MVNLVSVSFEILLTAIAGLLGISYYSFLRMKPDIRRARIFLMADRIQRFLLGFFVGFAALMVVILISFTGMTLPSVVGTAAVFLFIGSVAYGSLELLLIARPVGWKKRRKGIASSAERQRARHAAGPDLEHREDERSTDEPSGPA